jgi:hypothetical protein
VGQQAPSQSRVLEITKVVIMVTENSLVEA